jgi:signal transduction histidine kinase
VTVHNTPPTADPHPALPATGSGFGLTALRQRVEAVHGTLHATPTDDGGYLVKVVLPAYIPTGH